MGVRRELSYRGQMYEYLATALLRRPQNSTLEYFVAKLNTEDAIQPSWEAVQKHVEDLLELLEYPERWVPLTREYTFLLEGGSGDAVPLWESTYRGGENILLDATTLKVKRAYKKRRTLAVKEEEHQIPDHIGYELGFLAVLNRDLLSLGETEKIDLNIREQAAFLKEHILGFLSSFCERLKEAATLSYYKSLSELLLGFINDDMNYLLELSSSGIAEEFRLAVGPEEVYEKVLPEKLGFRSLSPLELEEEEVSVVSTAGRNNCGGKCVIYAHVQEGCMLKISTAAAPCGEEELLTSCVRGKGYRKSFLNAARLRYPLRRVGERGEGKFERITWEEAVDTIARELKEKGEKYGPDSRYINYSSGISAAIRGDLIANRILAQDGGYLGLYNSYSSAAAGIATPYSYGTSFSGSTSDTFPDSKLIILWGHNPVESGFGNNTLTDLIRAKKRGTRIIVIDPRFSDTAAAYADEWIQIRPTTDSALADALAYVIITENLHDKDFLDKYCIGFDSRHMPEDLQKAESYLEYILGERDHIPKTPEWAEAVTGVERNDIVRLAREYALSKPAALILGLGPQRHGNGEQTVRSSTVLTCITGNVGIRGGSASGCGFVQQHKMPMGKPLPNPAGVSIPSFLWTDAITRGAEMTAERDGVLGKQRLNTPIKLILNLGGNTLLNQHSDINQTAKILRDTSMCEFIVCSDLFMTPSARFADILLPGTSMFEGDNIVLPWRQGDYLLYNNRAVKPLFEGRFEFDWLVEVADRMGVDRRIVTDGHPTLQSWLRGIYEEVRVEETELPDFDTFTREGGYQYKERRTFIAFQKQIEDPEHNPFPTPSGKIEIFSRRLYDMKNPEEIPAIPKYVPSFEGPQDPLIQKYPLQLIGWHTKVRSHSVHDHNDWKLAVEKQEAWMNPKDAKERAIEDGALVEIWNDRGSMRVPIHVTNRIMAGVAAISQGAWFLPDFKGVDTGGSINVLTTLRPTPLAKGNPQHSNLVEIKKYAREPVLGTGRQPGASLEFLKEMMERDDGKG